MSEEDKWMADWDVGLRIWVERSGQAILGQGRLELLEEIERCHSISGAARKAGMSYRHAWVLVQEINDAAGEPLVIAAKGGSHGGGAQLTPHGHMAVVVFRDLQERLHRVAASLSPQMPPHFTSSCVHVMAAISLEGVLGQLLTDFSLRNPAVQVRVIFGASDELADQILGGALADLFLTAEPRLLDRLEASGLVNSGVTRCVAENSLAAIGPTNHAMPVQNASDLLGPAVHRVALAAPSTPLGGYTRGYLENLGLYAPLERRIVQVENSQAVVASIRASQADVGLVYGSAATSASDCRVLFRVKRMPAPIRYMGAIICRGQHGEEARSLLKFLTSRPAAARFRRCGFQRAHRSIA